MLDIHILCKITQEVINMNLVEPIWDKYKIEAFIHI